MTHPSLTARADNASDRPPLEVADIFRGWGAVYRDTHVVSHEQLAVMRAIETCRTEALGGHLDVCAGCGFQRPAYNSCRNRHCTKCQSLPQARWIAGRKARVLPTKHFHVVFTLPSELRPLALANRRAIYGLLFRTTAATLFEFGDDPKHLGAKLGITSVLHTWTRDLRVHPHVHCIVTSGGLSPDGHSWRKTKGADKFLFHVRPLGMVFKGKFKEGLRELHAAGKLRMTGTMAPYSCDRGFKVFLDDIGDKSWVVYAKRPFGCSDYLFEYLGRYTHRVAISNQRLVALEGDQVRFRTHGAKTTTLHALEFIARFLNHVLPKRFTKIRHYGLYASSNIKGRLAKARRILEAAQRRGYDTGLPETRDTPPAPPTGWRELLLALTGDDFTRCPKCKHALDKYPLPLFDDMIKNRGPPRAPPQATPA